MQFVVSGGNSTVPGRIVYPPIIDFPALWPAYECNFMGRRPSTESAQI